MVLPGTDARSFGYRGCDTLQSRPDRGHANTVFQNGTDDLHRWHALAICNPLPTPDTTYIGGSSGIQPTTFSACLDNAYLTNIELIGGVEMTIGISTWLCQDYLPEPPAILRQRCDLNHIADTQELYPEWPEDLHKWHAINASAYRNGS